MADAIGSTYFGEDAFIFALTAPDIRTPTGAIAVPYSTGAIAVPVSSGAVAS